MDLKKSTPKSNRSKPEDDQASKVDRNLYSHISIIREDLRKKIETIKEAKNEVQINNDGSVKSLLPLDSLFLKTGRAFETCFSDDFCELYLIKLEMFDTELFPDFPKEMNDLKSMILTSGNDKLKINKCDPDNSVFLHSSRSVGEYYEETYNEENIWIEIITSSNFINKQEVNVDLIFDGISNGLATSIGMSKNIITNYYLDKLRKITHSE